VLVGASDSAWQRVYVHDQVASNQRLRLRFEGYGSWSATVVNMVWEASFYTNNTLTLCVGSTNANAGAVGTQTGVTNGAGRWFSSFPLALNTLYVINGLASA
jgi:hypothetical protein